MIVGHGAVKTFVDAFDCTGNGTMQWGACGPRLVRFDERHPPVMRATGAPGWRLARWESELREPDGRIKPRALPMPDGRMYIDGFGYADTGELETVTAVFVPVVDGRDDLGDDDARVRK